MKVDISVVIPLFNKFSSFPRTIESVLSQTSPPAEIVVVDDGSTDGSTEHEHRYRDVPSVRWIRQENQGVSIARNEGARIARGEFLTFLDADDYWEPDFLASMRELVSLHPDGEIYGAAYQEESGRRGKIRCRNSLPEGFRGKIDRYFDIAENGILFHTSATVVRRDPFLALGGFPAALKKGEDLFVWFKLAARSKSYYWNRPLGVYSQDTENRVMNKPTPIEGVLAWRFEEYFAEELRRDDFRRFVARHRLQHVRNSCIGQRAEVRDGKKMLELIPKKHLPAFWRWLNILPWMLMPGIYRMVMRLDLTVFRIGKGLGFNKERRWSAP